MLHPFLKTFRSVARSGSFNKASQELFLSATAVRKQMNQLEHELGLRLFIRDKLGIRLTEEGKVLDADLDELFELSRKILDRAKQVAHSPGIFIAFP